MRRRYTTFTAAIAIAVAAGATPRAAHAPAQPRLAGTWTLDRDHSSIPGPDEIGFDLAASPRAAGASGAGGRSSGRGGRGGGSSGGSIAANGIVGASLESEDDANRKKQLVAEVKTPPVKLTIAQTPTSLAVTMPDGRTRTFHTKRKEDIQQLDGVPVGTTSKWSGVQFVVTYEVEKDRELRYAYARANDSSPLTVEIRFVEHGHAGDAITCVYAAAADR